MAAPARSRRPYAARMPLDERREQLLDAALAVIARDGYAGVTIEAIARQAGVTRPVVYGAFDDLGVLLATLLERQEQRAIAQLTEVVPADPGESDPDELVVAGLVAFLEAVAREPDTWRPILMPPEGTPVPVRERVERQRAAFAGRLEQLCAWGLERRGGPAGLDVELLARAILVLGEGAGRLVLADPQRYPPRRFADFARAALGATAARPA